MYKLRLLGRIKLVGKSGAEVRSVLSQPKRVALLTYLAAALPEPCSRDRLVGVFWPELEPDHARHALSQALYYLRRSLGKHTVISDEGDLVRLSLERVDCDLHRFRSALRARDWEGALGLLEGEFLEDFALAQAPEFERWVEEVRREVTVQARDAALAASEEAEARGDAEAALRWARMAVHLAPLEERPIRRHLAALRAVGDRSGALAAYRRFRVRLMEELEVEPSEATRALAESIAGADPPPAEAEAVPEPARPQPQAEAAPEPVPTAAPALAVGRKRRRVRSLLTFGAGPVSVTGWAVAVALGLSLALMSRGSPPGAQAEPGSSIRMAVLPFAYQGAEPYAHLGIGVAELLSISLGDLPPFQPVDLQAVRLEVGVPGPQGPPAEAGERVARRFGADFYVMGTVLEIGGRLEVITYLYRPGGELVTTLRAHAMDESGVFRVVDDLVRGLVAVEHLDLGSHLGRTAALTTHSYAALRSFLEGEERYRRGQYAEALAALEKAVALDESFALAYYRGALSALWMGSPHFDTARAWVARAASHQDRLPEEESLLIQALEAFLEGQPRKSERLYRRILAARPENVEAWFNLGEVLFHYGPGMGRDPFASREAWERVLEIQPDHRGALFHLALTSAGEGDLEGLTGSLARLREVDARAGASLSVEALDAWARGDQTAQRAVLDRARNEPARAVHWAVEYLVRYLHELEGALQMAGVLVELASTPRELFDAHGRMALLQAARARLAEAERELERAEAADPDAGAVLRAYLATLPETPLVLRSLAALSREHAREDPPGVLPVRDATPRLLAGRDPLGGIQPASPAQAEAPEADLRLYLSGLLAARTDPGGAAVHERLDALEHLVQRNPTAYPMAASFAAALGAEANLRSHRRAEALSALKPVFDEMGVWYEKTRISPVHSLARERFLLATLLVEAGHPEPAARWLETLVRSSLGEAPLLVPSRLQLAAIHASRGEREEEARLYRQALALWADADPAWAPVLDEIGSRLAELGTDLGG